MTIHLYIVYLPRVVWGKKLKIQRTTRVPPSIRYIWRFYGTLNRKLLRRTHLLALVLLFGLLFIII